MRQIDDAIKRAIAIRGGIALFIHVAPETGIAKKNTTVNIALAIFRMRYRRRIFRVNPTVITHSLRTRSQTKKNRKPLTTNSKAQIGEHEATDILRISSGPTGTFVFAQRLGS